MVALSRNSKGGKSSTEGQAQLGTKPSVPNRGNLFMPDVGLVSQGGCLFQLRPLGLFPTPVKHWAAGSAREDPAAAE